MDKTLCTLVAIICITAVIIALILTDQVDATLLAIFVAALAGLGGYVLPSPLKQGESKNETKTVEE